MAKKILALSISIMMVMSLFAALPVSATVVLPDNIGSDYEATDVIEGNLFTDLDTVSGYTPTNSHTTGNTWVDGAYVHEKIVLAGETLDTESALYKRGDISFANWTMGNGFTMTSNRDVLDPWSVYTDEDSDGVYTLDESTQSYKRALAGVQLKVMDVTYGETVTAKTNNYPTPEYTRNVVVRVPLNIKSGTGTAKVNIARSKYQSDAMGGPNYYSYTGNQASDHEYPIEYNGRDQGIEVAADGKTYLIATFAGNTTATSDPKYSYTLGMVEGTDAGITVYVSDEDYYIGYEYAKDLILEAYNTNLLAGSGNISVSTEVLNQLGVKGGLSQGVTWYALNAERNAAVDGFTVVEGTDGTATISADSTVASGTYTIAAVANENAELVKSIQVTVHNVDLSKDYVAGAIAGNMYYAPASGSEVAVSLTSNSSKVQFFSNATGDLIFSNSAVIGDGIEAQSANQAVGATVGKNYWDWQTLHVNGEKFIIGAQVKATAGTPKFTAGFFEQNRVGDRPDGFAVTDGVDITWSEYAPVCVHMTMTKARNNSENMTYSSLSIGMPEDPAGTTEVGSRSFVMKPGSLFIGYEAAHDMTVSGGGLVTADAPITVNAQVTNQLGVKGYLSQGVTWIAMNTERTEKVSGFTFTEGENGVTTVSVDGTVAGGDYTLVAVADENPEIVKSVSVSVLNLAKDYVPGAVKGDLIADAEESWSHDGSVSSMQVNTKPDTNEWYALYPSTATNIGNNKFGVSGSPIYLKNLKAIAKSGDHVVFGALVNGLYDTPTINATMWDNANDPIYPIEYGAGEGYSPDYGGGYEQFGVTFELTDSITASGCWNMMMRMGFVNGSTTENAAGEAFVIKKGSMYLGIEYAYDMKIAPIEEEIYAGSTFTVDADVLNQVGSTGYLSQDVTWYAMNEARTDVVDGITVVEGANGTATVTLADDIEAGTYKLVAVADEYTNIVKSVDIVVEGEKPVIEGITIEATAGGITVSTDKDLTDAQLIFVTYENGRLVAVNIDTKVTLDAQCTQEYAIPAGFESAKVMLWESLSKCVPLAKALN